MLDARIIGSGGLAGLLCGSIIYLFSLQGTVEQLREQVRIGAASQRIANDQIADLTYQLQQAKTEQQFANTREFVAGAVDALRRPEYYEEIWHAGYDRGTAVEQYTQAVAAESSGKAYTSAPK